MNKIRFVLSLMLLITAFTTYAQDWPSMNLNEIVNDRHKAVRITVNSDPVYKTPKQYLGYPLKEIIETLKIPKPFHAEDMVLVFTAKDGYRVAMSYSDAVKEQGFVAFKDTAAENGNWLEFKFGKQKMTPAPFYLVWPNKGLDKWRYPWPFQLTTISLEPSSVYFGAAAPRSADAEIQKGFNLFSSYCIRCHSVNLAGGQVGPELNVPKNITEYFIDRELSGFIINAPAYRAGTKMPAFNTTLDADQVSAIVHYLEHMKTEKVNAEQ
ncbi:MAG: c-type cytochrome [Gammaproteobacteria bacterium]